MSALARLLIGSQFAFNTGFFAVLPYLAGHLGGTLGLGGWMVGLVLGLRTFSQQGLFVVGGALTDRFGPRPVVLAGCALRVAGFAWLAWAQSVGAVVAAVVLVGFAAALFSPAVESEVAREAVRLEEATGLPRTRLPARFSAAGQAGALLGPALGAVLLAGDFRMACRAGAVVFLLVLAGHARLMPRRAGTAGRGRAAPGPDGAHGLGGVLRHRRFLALTAAYAAYLLAYNQLYLALPAELDRVTGSQAALGWLFALSSALVVAGQLPLERWAARRLSWGASVRLGLVVVAAAFAAGGALRDAGGLWPAVVFVVLLSVGQMLVSPAVRAWLPDLVDARRLGLYTGAMSSLAGLVVLVGGAPAGALVGTGWYGPALAAVALLGVVAVPRGAARAGTGAVGAAGPAEAARRGR
ncbi:MFS transporter [Streptomyces roseolilacinus]|uniref:MFS transporter n=1 Tax=Streptomyces roseolilacinus TaxID=66904 RepID=A0A918B553_9ACTN|nr:MFS transporter [Streptomyces roseolilacinus]GGQ31111.1 MFS transporter [Streptomyces roseolilacinus]